MSDKESLLEKIKNCDPEKDLRKLIKIVKEHSDDREIVLATVASNPDVIQYIDCKLFNDEEFISSICKAAGIGLNKRIEIYDAQGKESPMLEWLDEINDAIENKKEEFNRQGWKSK